MANYEGFVFYRSLFEDGVIAGKPAILRWESGRWIVQREFDWADHVNAYWDEALNINHYDALLYPHMHARLLQFCPQYWRQPALHVVDREAFADAESVSEFGPPDHLVLDRALELCDELSAGAHPFGLVVLTASNHPPFALPDPMPEAAAAALVPAGDDVRQKALGA